MEGDGEANYAYYVLHKLHILPSVFLAMGEREKAFVVAAVKVRLEQEKKMRERLEKKM